MFEIKKLYEIKFESNDCISCLDGENKKHTYLLSKDIIDLISSEIGLKSNLIKDLYNTCKKAFDTLISEKFNLDKFENYYFITWNNIIVSYIPNDEAFEKISNNVAFMYTLLGKENRVIKTTANSVEIKVSEYKENNKDDYVFFDMFFDFNKGIYNIYKGYKTIITVDNIKMPLITEVEEIINKKTFLDIVDNEYLKSYFNYIDSDFEYYKNIYDNYIIEDERFKEECTADFLVNKLKKFHIKTTLDKSGMLMDIDNFDCYIGDKLITSINSVNEKYKVLLKAKEVVIPHNNKFTIIEFVSVLTQMYFMNIYELYDFGISIKDICEFLNKFE